MLAAMAIVTRELSLNTVGRVENKGIRPSIFFLSPRIGAPGYHFGRGTWGTACAGLLTNVIHTRGSYALFARLHLSNSSRD